MNKLVANLELCDDDVNPKSVSVIRKYELNPIRILTE